MTEKHRWKTIIQYTAGILLLALSVAAAIFVPGWYAAWQDERMLDHVTLSSRESITFLDVDSLDIEGRLRMLQEAEKISFGDAYYYTAVSEEETWQKMKELLFKWCDAGLLPEKVRQWVEPARFFTDGMMFLTPYGIYVDEALMPVCIGRFVSEDYGNMLTIVMDAEKDILYYVSCSGEDIMDEMAKELGYDSFEAMQWLRRTGMGETEATADDVYSSFDFASVCGAEDAEISGSSNALEMDVTLKFESFNSYAYRRVMSNEYGFGMVIMYGTRWWQELLPQMTEMYGFVEQMETTDSWYMFVDGIMDQENYSFAEDKEKLIE